MTGSGWLRTLIVGAITVATYACAIAALATVPPLLGLTGRLTAGELASFWLFGSAFLGLPAVGAMLAVHRPSNPIGRTLLGFGAGLYVMLLVSGLTELTVLRTGAVEGAQLYLAGLLAAASPVLLALVVHLLLYFPNGELQGRARWLSRACVATVAALAVARLLRPGRLDMDTEVANPFGQAWAGPLDALVGPLTLAVIGMGLLALARLVRRFRAADAVERTQFRWILTALGSIPVLIGLATLVEVAVGNELLTTMLILAGFNVGFLGFALALYRAVTKQDLYGIGRVLSRSVTYALVVLVLATVYLGLVVGLGAAARAITGESGDLVVALSTLAVAALFQPVRQRVRGVVDRRFDRARYDAARTVDTFGRGLRDELGLMAITEELRSVVSGTFLPARVGVVLVGTGGRP